MKSILIKTYPSGDKVFAEVDSDGVQGVCMTADNGGDPCDIDRKTAEFLFGGKLYRAGWMEAGNQFSDNGYWSNNPESECLEDFEG